MNQYHCLTLILLLLSQSFATIPGLRLPAWYTAEFVSNGHPGINSKASVELRFTPIGLTLQDVSVELKAPDGVMGKALHPVVSIAELKTSTSFLWEVLADKSVSPSSLQAIVRFKTPYQGLKNRIDEVWQREALWQRNQLKARVDDLMETYELSFYIPIFTTPYEGDFKLPSSPIHKAHNIGPDDLIYLLAPAAQTGPIPALTARLLSASDQHKNLFANPDTLNAIQSTDPGYILKVADEYQQVTYSLAYAHFSEKNYADALQVLRQNQKALLEAKGVSYEYILQSRNLEALVLYSQNRAEDAEEILKSTVRTMTEAQSRPYLLYNLSVLHILNKQPNLAMISLNEAIRQHPGLHIAKKLLLEL